MNTLINARNYYEDKVFSSENVQIFLRQWVFACFLSDLTAHNDYVCMNRGGRSLVIQNFHGEIYAFDNVCSHRFAELKSEGKGNGALRCPYHGWTYDCTGLPYAIPKRPRFDDLTPERLECLKLSSWQVASIGQFVFVKYDDSSDLSLENFLGANVCQLLRNVSECMGECIDVNMIHLHCNGKIAVENTLESYHVGFIHPTTFHKLGANGEDFEFEGSHSRWNAALSEVTLVKWEKTSHIFASRSFHAPGYIHQFIFPNLTIATTFGNSFSIQLFDPESAEFTNFTSYVYDAKLNDITELQSKMAAMMNQSIVSFNRSVFQEDKGVCESVQRGCRLVKGDGVLSDEELRVHHFQQQYQLYMNQPQ